MDHDHDDHIREASFTVEQDDFNKPLSASNFDVGISQIIPLRLIPIYTARKPTRDIMISEKKIFEKKQHRQEQPT